LLLQLVVATILGTATVICADRLVREILVVETFCWYFPSSQIGEAGMWQRKLLPLRLLLEDRPRLEILFVQESVGHTEHY
jgi:hypothetical protein